MEQALVTANQELYNKQLEATKQKRAAEEQLKSTEARKKLLENELDLILKIKDQDERIKDDLLAGKDIDITSLLDYKTEALKMYDKALADGTITQEEFNKAQETLTNENMQDRFLSLTGLYNDADSSAGLFGQTIDDLDVQTQGLNKTVEENQKILDDSEKSIDANREAAEEMVGVTDDGVDALKRENGELPPL